MKVKRIKRLIESLNESELRQLGKLLEAPFPENSAYEKRKNFSVETLAEKIEYRELEETKEILMIQELNGNSVAHYLAGNSNKTGWLTNDKDILMLQNKYGNSVAHYLASWHPTWSTENIEILSLANSWGKTVEDILIREGKK